MQFCGLKWHFHVNCLVLISCSSVFTTFICHILVLAWPVGFCELKWTASFFYIFITKKLKYTPGRENSTINHHLSITQIQRLSAFCHLYTISLSLFHFSPYEILKGESKTPLHFTLKCFRCEFLKNKNIFLHNNDTLKHLTKITIIL